ncbi:MAG: flavodoxin domain-containing protein [Anaerolineae bacterium]|nr:flavodoxin domain-containing protein [Anaerolineae bacterium]
MGDSVLVGYATRYGSTREVAEAVAAVLREGGLAVDVRPVREVKRLDSYCAVVLGAPFYIGSWHKDALAFVRDQGAALAGRPVALFALGPLADDEAEGARGQLDQLLEKLSPLAPIDAALFGGKYDPSHLRLADRLLAALPASPLHGVPARDARDWAAIEAWARGVARSVQRTSEARGM